VAVAIVGQAIVVGGLPSARRVGGPAPFTREQRRDAHREVGFEARNPPNSHPQNGGTYGTLLQGLRQREQQSVKA
jgi:hypothetical protein